MLATLVAGTALPAAAWAQATQANSQDDAGADIIVNARRVEERLQDVPISITVFNQAQLTNNNITNAKDLATYTPGLQVNSRNGSDATNFSIRGFTQEQRTSATVGTYFADVVAPRGSGASFGGDGAGPGSLFDLQNVQVLKGPQGTLQGRNVTGGAVLLVPRKPTGRLEGYVEGSLGDYDMKRIQAVLNVPVMNTFRLRLGVDHMNRDGYLHNIGTLGDGLEGNHGMGDVNYTAARVSAVADLTPDLEDYFIGSYSQSQSNGVVPKLISCNPSVTGQNFGVLTQPRCQAQLDREAGYGPYTVENRLPDAHSRIEQWQLINTITWRASDELTVKNITSYAEFRQSLNLDLFGNYYLQTAATNPATITSPAQVTGFAFSHTDPFTRKTNAQSSFVEELQFQGRSGDKFVWQAGGYMEINDPLGFSGVQTGTGSACADINTLNCVAQPGFSLGSINYQESRTRFTDYALYGQASYSITSQLKFTAGIRYTWDNESSDINIQRISAATPNVSSCANATAPGFGVTFPSSERFGRCLQHLSKGSKAPTWLLGLDYKPIDNILLYAKYSRGYRAAGLSLFGPDSAPPSTTNLQPYSKEKVDSYEVGAKTSWRGAIPGTFNISGFYNDFTDQQLLLGAILGSSPNALVANAGKSRLYGLETDVTLRPFRGMNISVAYAYLNTKLQKFVPVNVGAGVTLTPPRVGDSIPNSQPHKLNVSADYTLPFVPDSIGKLTVGGTFVYTASYDGVAPSCPVADGTTCVVSALKNRRIPDSKLVNVNVNLDNIAGLPIDASFFVTNLTKEVYYVSVNDNTSRGFVSRLLGEPRMFGARLRYRFGR